MDDHERRRASHEGVNRTDVVLRSWRKASHSEGTSLWNVAVASSGIGISHFGHPIGSGLSRALLIHGSSGRICSVVGRALTLMTLMGRGHPNGMLLLRVAKKMLPGLWLLLLLLRNPVLVLLMLLVGKSWTIVGHARALVLLVGVLRCVR